MSLLKDYETSKKNGGINAIKGYNFQTYVGIYYMFYLFKNSQKFKIYFEKDDDIELYNETLNEKFKVQCKTSSITANFICKKNQENESILDKLFSKNGYSKYVLSYPIEKCKQLKNDFSIVSNKSLGRDCYKINVPTSLKNIDDFFKNSSYKIDDLIFQELSFSNQKDNAFRYLIGYAQSNENSEKEFNISDKQLESLLGSIFRISAKENNIGYLTEKELETVYYSCQDDEILKELIDEIFTESLFVKKYIIRATKNKYHNHKIVIHQKLSKYNLEYDNTFSTQQYFLNNLKKIQKNEKNMAFYEISWYLLEKILDSVKKELSDEIFN